MSGEIVGGPKDWRISVDSEGYKTYKLKLQVKALVTDGPNEILDTPGLPLPGSIWDIDGDVDPYAHCKWDLTANPVKEDSPNIWWLLEFTYSTKPDKRCQTTPIDNQLLEPQKISGSFVKYQYQAIYDRYGNPILNSAREPYKGNQVEFDQNRPQIKIEQNVADLQLPLLVQMIDTLNDSKLWGLPPRCIKLGVPGWERKFQGECGIYFTRILEFDIRWESFDRDLVDEGSKCLRGDWDRKVNSPSYRQWVVSPGVTGQGEMDFVAFRDWAGNPCHVILDGHGMPAVRDILSSNVTLGAASVQTSGSGGYVEGDVLTVSGGTAATPATLTVVEASAGDIVLIEVKNGGSYSSAPANPAATTGGTGSGATLNLTWLRGPLKAVKVTIIADGGGYASGDTITLAGGTSTETTVLLITSADSSGHIEDGGVVIQTGGHYTVVPGDPVPQASTSGSGSGATFHIEWETIISFEDVGNIHVEYYLQSNFLLLGIPTDIALTFPIVTGGG